MFELLAALTAEGVVETVQVVHPGALQTYGPIGAVLLAMGGWKGIAQALLYFQGRTGKRYRTSENGKHVSEAMCKLRHAELEKRADERYDTLVGGINEVKAGIQLLHERVNEIISK